MLRAIPYDEWFLSMLENITPSKIRWWTPSTGYKPVEYFRHFKINRKTYIKVRWKKDYKLKQAGLWGMERRKISFWKSGSLVLFRLPTKLARVLHLKSKGEGYVYPEGKNKLVIEF